MIEAAQAGATHRGCVNSLSYFRPAVVASDGPADPAGKPTPVEVRVAESQRTLVEIEANPVFQVRKVR